VIPGTSGAGGASPDARRSSLDAGLRVLTDHEIFRRERRIRRARKYAGGVALEMVSALRPGDYVVHLEQGVGIYRGIETIFVGQSTVEVAVLEYEGGDRLNVPLYRIDQVERYRAAGDVSSDAPPPRLHRLGGKRWAQQRDKTRAAIQEMTAELLDLYARRKVAERVPHQPDTQWQRQLESSFLFEDTPDQRKATVDVKRDMEGARPMDRLLVGDVGYGKTEIAVRAAFKAVQSGRQVAGARPHHDPRGPARAHLRRPARRLPGARGGDEPLPDREGAGRGARRAQAEEDRRRDRHPPPAEPRRRVRRPRLIIVDEEHRFGVKHKERSSSCGSRRTCSPSRPRRSRARSTSRSPACAT
jgi:transcription-repair coupling factor (superfamily II helicase)